MPRLRSRVRDSFPAPLAQGRGSKVVMQRPAKPWTPVRFRPPPPFARVVKQVDTTDLKSVAPKTGVPVRFRLRAPLTQRLKMPFFYYCVIIDSFADVAKLVDALDLGSSAERRESSSLSIRTIPLIQAA